MNQAKLYIGGALLLAAFLAGWTIQGWRSNAVIADMQADAAKAAIEAQKKVDEVEALQEQLSETIAEKQAIEARKNEVVTKYITKKVIEYVKSPDSGKCDLPNDWVRVHDAAARGMPEAAETASGFNDPTPRITDIEALEVTTANYAICHETATRLRNLQLWAKGLQNAEP